MDMVDLSPERKELLCAYWAKRPLGELADFISMHYHGRACQMIPALQDTIEALLTALPEELLDVRLPLKHLLQLLTEDMMHHLRTEEDRVFPAIRALEAGHTPVAQIRSFGHIHDEHDQIIDTLVRLKLVSTLCRMPELGCPRCGGLQDQLAVLLTDLQEHVFLEDGILLARAIEMEQRLGFSPDTEGGRS